MWPAAKLLVEFIDTSFRPLSAFWTSLATYYSHTCINVGVYMLSFSIITIFLDPLLLLMPIPIVWTLQLSLKQRIAVLTLFAIGFIVCIAGIVQAVYVNEALVKSYDETWVGWPLWITTAIEVDLEIVRTIMCYSLGKRSLTDLSCVSRSRQFVPCLPSIYHNSLNHSVH